jgi:hypothetical protein
MIHQYSGSLSPGLQARVPVVEQCYWRSSGPHRILENNTSSPTPSFLLIFYLLLCPPHTTVLHLFPTQHLLFIKHNRPRISRALPYTRIRLIHPRQILLSTAVDHSQNKPGEPDKGARPLLFRLFRVTVQGMLRQGNRPPMLEDPPSAIHRTLAHSWVTLLPSLTTVKPTRPTTSTPLRLRYTHRNLRLSRFTHT